MFEELLTAGAAGRAGAVGGSDGGENVARVIVVRDCPDRGRADDRVAHRASFESLSSGTRPRTGAGARVTVGPGEPEFELTGAESSHVDPDSLVLVVDDDRGRESLMDVLTAAGIRALGCGRTEEALELQAVHHPAVVIVDYRLPEGSGAELARALKDRDPELAMLLLTEYASFDDAVASVGQLDAYLIKPVAPEAFLQTTNNALARRGLVIENRSLTERLERLNAFQALYDPLTGLPNRASARRPPRPGARRCATPAANVLAVLFVDLDTFKVVNDLFGHHVGDQLLRQMADRLSAARRSSDTVARFGGDEFVVVCPDVKHRPWRAG